MFNHTILKPDFLDYINSTDGSRSHLLPLSELPVEYLFLIELALYSPIAQQHLNYTATLHSWEASRIQIHLNFSDPLLISQAEIDDILIFSINDPSVFVSNITL